jgi:hypothetical protein
MANPAGESNGEALRFDFDSRLTLQFRGSVVTVLRLIAELRPPPVTRRRRAFGRHAFVQTHRRRVSWSTKIWPSKRSTRLRRASAAFVEEPAAVRPHVHACPGPKIVADCG